MMEKKGRSFALLLLSVILLFCTGATSVYAWFVSVSRLDNVKIEASSLDNYFARGDGTAENPFVLTSPLHVYNLSWLQNSGYFNSEPFNGQVYFELGNDIDMLAENSSVKYAIPPIGTTVNPFTGSFVGGGNVIKNLWISTIPDDWKEKPADKTVDIGTAAGLFGAVGEGAVVKEFYLQDIKVTTDMNNGNVGFIAGNVGETDKDYTATVSTIGVINGKICAPGGTVLNSRYSLIGWTPDGAEWEGLPSNTAGGDLVITPQIFTSQIGVGSALSGALAVEGAVPGTAYYIPTVQVTSAKTPQAQLYDLRNYGTDGLTPLFQSDPNADNYQAQQKIESAFSYYMNQAKQPALYVMGVPDTSSLQSITSNSGETVSVPKNGVWFKPTQSGTAALAFAKTNNKSDRNMAIYKYRRNGADSLTQVAKTTFLLPKALTNGSIVYYEYVISSADVDAGYEYVIGPATSADADGTAGFLAMALAGTDTSGGTAPGGVGVKLDKLDFLASKPDAFPDTVHYSVLSISGTAAAVAPDTQQELLYNAVISGTEDNVHYYTASGGATITENITNNPQSAAETSTNVFPEIRP